MYNRPWFIVPVIICVAIASWSAAKIALDFKGNLEWAMPLCSASILFGVFFIDLMGHKEGVK